MSGSAPIVIPNKTYADEHHCGKWQNESRKSHAPRGTLLAAKPPSEHDHYRNAEDKPFEWPAICQNGSAYAQQQRVPQPMKTPNARQGSDNQRPSGRRDSAAPVTVHPESENPKAKKH